MPFDSTGIHTLKFELYSDSFKCYVGHVNRKTMLISKPNLK